MVLNLFLLNVPKISKKHASSAGREGRPCSGGSGEAEVVSRIPSGPGSPVSGETSGQIG
mgnify:CR=1 FL=1